MKPIIWLSPSLGCKGKRGPEKQDKAETLQLANIIEPSCAIV